MKIRGLGYIGFHATDLAPWRSFAEALLGMMPTTAPSGAGAQDALFYRLDERSWRVAVHRSEQPGLAYLGWELADRDALAAAADHLRRSRVKLERSDPAAGNAMSGRAAARGVRELVAFADPDGNQHELFYGASASPSERFASPAGVSGFVTENGMGHVLFVVRDVAAAEAWYGRVMGLRTTDRMDMGAGKRAVFMRCGARHHAIAVTDVLPQPMFHHLMIEAAELEDVGKAWDRVQRTNGPVMMTIGQHGNDPMLSFYLTTPSGFGIEFGCGGTLVDDARWQTRDVGPEELWGHRGPTMDAIEAGGGRA